MAKITASSNEKVFHIKRWLGVNENPDGDTKLKMGEAAVMQNFRITDDGSLQVRPGSKNVANLLFAYTVDEAAEATTVVTELNASTRNFAFYPSYSITDGGILTGYGTEVTANYSDHETYVGYYYEDGNGNLYKFANCEYIQPSAGTPVDGGTASLNDDTINVTAASWTQLLKVPQYPSVYVRGGKVYTTGEPSAIGSAPDVGRYFNMNGKVYQTTHSGWFQQVYYWSYASVSCADDVYKWNFYPVTVKATTTDEPVMGIWSGYVAGVEYLVAACNGHLWSLTIDDDTGLWSKKVIGTLDTSRRVSFFGFNEKLYMLNGSEYRVWDGTNYGDVQGYRPIVAVAAPPAGGGTLLEQVNKLTAAKRQWFSPAASAKDFQLLEKDIASVDWVKENGTLVDSSEYTVNIANGTVSFTTAPIDGTNTIEIAWTGKHNDRAAVLGMSCAELYNGTTDNRIFLYGDGSNLTLYSGLEHETGSATAEYFPDLYVMHVGDANTPVTSLVRHYNRLMAFKEDSAYSIYYDAITLENGTVTAGFYITTINRGLGNSAAGQVTLVENYPRSLDGRSIYEWKATSTGGNVTGDQRNAKRISQRVENTLSRFVLKDAIAYFDKINHEYYLAYDRRVIVQNTEVDAWYVYENLPATAIIVYKDEVYIGTDDGYIRHLSRNYMHDNGEPIQAYWESGSMDFGAAYMRKYSSGLWLGIKPEANGEIKVTAITDRVNQLNEEVAEANTKTAEWKTSASGFFSFLDLDFETLSFNVNSMPSIDTQKIRAKKFTYYKLIFSSANNNTTATVTSANISVRFMGKVR